MWIRQRVRIGIQRLIYKPISCVNYRTSLAPFTPALPVSALRINLTKSCSHQSFANFFYIFFSPDFHPQIAQLGNDLRRPFWVTAFCKFFLHRLSSTISHHNHATQPLLYRIFHVPSACTTLQALYAKSTIPSPPSFLRTFAFKLRR